MSELIERLRQLSLMLHDDFSVGDEAADEIIRLRKIETAAKNLIAVKGRHHAEIAYKRLEDALKGDE